MRNVRCAVLRVAMRLPGRKTSLMFTSSLVSQRCATRICAWRPVLKWRILRVCRHRGWYRIGVSATGIGTDLTHGGMWPGVSHLRWYHVFAPGRAISLRASYAMPGTAIAYPCLCACHAMPGMGIVSVAMRLLCDVRLTQSSAISNQRSGIALPLSAYAPAMRYTVLAYAFPRLPTPWLYGVRTEIGIVARAAMKYAVLRREWLYQERPTRRE
eukprot:3940997-Rhodomonas_salina.3